MKRLGAEIERINVKDTRTQILRGAVEAFLEHGNISVSTQKIAACCRVSKGTLYLYFQRKDELFVASLEEEIRSRTTFSIDIPVEPYDVENSLKVMGVKYEERISAERALAILRTVTAESARFPSIARKYIEFNDNIFISRLEEFFRRCSDDGKLRFEELRLAAEKFTLLGVCERLTQKEVEVIVDSAVSVIMANYSTEPRQSL